MVNVTQSDESAEDFDQLEEPGLKIELDDLSDSAFNKEDYPDPTGIAGLAPVWMMSGDVQIVSPSAFTLKEPDEDFDLDEGDEI